MKTSPRLIVRPLEAAAAAACLLFHCLPVAAETSSSLKAYIAPSGTVSFELGDTRIANLRAGMFSEGWKGATQKERTQAVRTPDGYLQSAFSDSLGGEIHVAVQTSGENSDSLTMRTQLWPGKDLNLISLYSALQMESALFAGGTYEVVRENGEIRKGPLPPHFSQVGLFSGSARQVRITAPEGPVLCFVFQEPTPILIQDDRKWGENFTLRIGQQHVPAITWPAGRKYTIGCQIKSASGIEFLADHPVTITAGEDWRPLEEDSEITTGSALDFSHLVPWHAPAGALGRVLRKGEHFVFEKQPDQGVRFYGNNLCFTANYPDKENAIRLADQIQRFGYNVIRIHHYERALTGNDSGAEIKLDPHMLDRLDFLAAELKKRGVYLTTDLFVSRPVPAKRLWDGADGFLEMNDYKVAVLINSRAFEDYKVFARMLLEHVNAYTGARWADEPALAWISLINEGNPTLHRPHNPRLARELQQLWNQWARQHGTTEPKFLEQMSSDFGEAPGGTMASLFLADLHARFVSRMRTFLSEQIKCKALLTDLNCYRDTVQFQANRNDLDYADLHFYVDHPEFLERDWKLPSWCGNRNLLSSPEEFGGLNTALARVPGLPFALTEYNFSAPSRMRAVGGMMTGALAALQDWSLVTRFAWSHSDRGILPPVPMGYFDLTGDPLHAASERAAVCLFRRGDMQPARHRIVLQVDAQSTATPAQHSAPWKLLGLVTQVGCTAAKDATGTATRASGFYLHDGPDDTRGTLILQDRPGKEGQNAGRELLGVLEKKGLIDGGSAARSFRSETGELDLNAASGTFTISTDRTCGGAAGQGGEIKAKYLSARIADTPAAVWASSLDAQPLPKSRHILLVHLPPVLGNQASFGDHSCHVVTSFGTLPHLVRRAQAKVQLTLEHPEKYRVWRISTGGRRLGEVQGKVQGNVLELQLNTAARDKADIMYEVARD